jgi:hypothetical protein
MELWRERTNLSRSIVHPVLVLIVVSICTYRAHGQQSQCEVPPSGFSAVVKASSAWVGPDNALQVALSFDIYNQGPTTLFPPWNVSIYSPSYRKVLQVMAPW